MCYIPAKFRAGKDQSQAPGAEGLHVVRITLGHSHPRLRIQADVSRCPGRNGRSSIVRTKRPEGFEAGAGSGGIPLCTVNHHRH